ncbi:hypothetical protein VIOR3934_19830 [Vibrio orientalis CIP 102891 = ATCC 33934]|uniref:Uncharacterized protein n=1 Tax=Vibrio orientalis CIP 102891 = ATCC 33934 TaxID=675816 RepID=C9QG00_VIBOR|nr:hypothetical protein [Vibrio orientalis]EEX94345.1 hypothetical protein VIA_001503 [Vibrio orientalis CIP 102891 = ATCC 33934]EGU54111.1 hypothetical protein VIOR3934_19830 [Vibrio orientalis CIP 102891 = ATCC 33934]
MPRNYNDQMKIDHDFGWLDNEAQNREKYHEILKSEPQDITATAKIMFPPTYQLVRTELENDGFQVALLCGATEEVVYYIKCRVWADVVLAAKPVTQVLLWRTNLVQHLSATQGIAANIFRNYLLEEYNIIASDSCQTREGRDFWVRQLGYALAFQEYVYRFHRIECSLERLEDPRAIADNSCDLWGDDDDYENVLAIISKNEITLD